MAFLLDDVSPQLQQEGSHEGTGPIHKGSGQTSAMSTLRPERRPVSTHSRLYSLNWS